MTQQWAGTLKAGQCQWEGNMLHGRSAYVKHKCRCDICTNENAAYSRSYRATHEKPDPELQWKRDLKKYNITIEEYRAILAEQDFRCGICHIPQDSLDYRLCVDHDHDCCRGDRSCGDCIRGLLCRRCNLLIGMAGDDEFLLLNAICYLEGD